MSQVPPAIPPEYPGFAHQNYPQNYSLPSVARTSGAAVCSLVCGLVICFPVASVVAVITGIIGVVETAKPTMKGRGMAIAGLILGIFSLSAQAAVGVGFYEIIRASHPQRVIARNFINDLAAGRIDACAAVATAKLTPDQIAAASKTMQPWGTLQDVRVLVLAFSSTNGNFAGVASGVCKFAGAQHGFTMMLVRDPSGQIKVDSFAWQN